ncbi:ABC transporter permease [Paenibacillus eucommiae]|uniref:Aldouronate transport system permease protein n=1 Tax=Paenibacillus eucommiae TaxID=1355755 RepID=A0ABS4J1G6_9BACL|nr:ABC transporter permease subunit [Paenibacillus eucommiae]MBP1993160.1 putative aldouronate transport system permease protein [Paenibacillus eucommiae]
MSITAEARTNGKQPAMRTKRRVYRKTVFALYLILAPTLLLLLLFKYMPMYGISIAFQDFSPYRGISGSPWVGLKHFAHFIQDETFWKVMQNTLIINFYDILFGFSAPIVFAILANELTHGMFKRVTQTISYLPHFLSWVVVAGVFYQILSPADGLVNEMLGWFSIEPIYFTTEKELFRGLIVSVGIWKDVGWSAILYFAVIAGIDSSLYEAAKVDGASRLRQIWHITLPGMVPMIILLLLLRLSSIFEIGFERMFVMQNPIVLDVSDVISTYVYRIGLQNSQYSLTTAIGFVQSVLGFLMLITANKASKKLSGMGLY